MTGLPALGPAVAALLAQPEIYAWRRRLIRQVAAAFIAAVLALFGFGFMALALLLALGPLVGDALAAVIVGLLVLLFAVIAALVAMVSGRGTPSASAVSGPSPLPQAPALGPTVPVDRPEEGASLAPSAFALGVAAALSPPVRRWLRRLGR